MRDPFDVGVGFVVYLDELAVLLDCISPDLHCLTALTTTEKQNICHGRHSHHL